MCEEQDILRLSGTHRSCVRVSGVCPRGLSRLSEERADLKVLFVYFEI